jgi:hypothetical protein
LDTRLGLVVNGLTCAHSADVGFTAQLSREGCVAHRFVQLPAGACLCPQH